MPSDSSPAMINKATQIISLGAPWRNSNHKLYKFFDEFAEFSLRKYYNIFENSFIR